VHEPFGKVADRTDKIIRALGTGREAYGLVHGDLHLGNVLFVGGEARAIDFDDCGYGPWVYDFAVTLANQWKSRDWPDLRDAFCAGYAAERELPDLADLEMICAGRLVSLGLWLAGLAESGPQARKMFERFLPSVEAGVRRFSERPAGRSKGPRPGRPGPRSRR
jgi:Ser/Thr protein kinase RdoA (MazF antagonist)